MQVFGFDAVQVTILICIIGVLYRILSGMAGKSWREFNPTLALTTFMLGIVTSIGLVAPIIDALPDNISPTLQMAAIVGQIGLIMGIDSGVRKGQKASQIIKEKITNKDPDPIDDPDDLPPGKPENYIMNGGTVGTIYGLSSKDNETFTVDSSNDNTPNDDTPINDVSSNYTPNDTTSENKKTSGLNTSVQNNMGKI